MNTIQKVWKRAAKLPAIANKYKIRFILLMAVLLVTAFVLIGLMQQTLIFTVYDITSSAVPRQFDGYRIVHISDFHSGINGAPVAEIVMMTAEQAPHIICLTGDIVDGRDGGFETVEELVSGLSDIAPVYAVSGNNEHYKSSINAQMEEIYKKYGVHNIDNKTVTIYDDGTLTLAGIADSKGSNSALEREILLLKYDSGKTGFGIIMHHRANEFDRMSGAGYELVLSGHLHGGIIRFPFIGGVLSPDGGLFPKYSGGLYYSNGAYLVSNRGIGNNYFVPRLYNPPEVVLVVLHTE